MASGVLGQHESSAQTNQRRATNGEVFNRVLPRLGRVAAHPLFGLGEPGLVQVFEGVGMHS